MKNVIDLGTPVTPSIFENKFEPEKWEKLRL